MHQAVLDNEPHLGKIARITTLAGYVHYLLTGRHEVGVGDASGIFPVKDGKYDSVMIEKYKKNLSNKGLPWDIKSVLPES